MVETGFSREPHFVVALATGERDELCRRCPVLRVELPAQIATVDVRKTEVEDDDGRREIIRHGEGRRTILRALNLVASAFEDHLQRSEKVGVVVDD